jgi:hypothetical protein
VERGADGIKLHAVMGRDMYEAAAGIGIEEGTWFRTVREKFSSMVGLL